MEHSTIALIVAVIAIIVGLALLFGGVGWYVSNSRNSNNPSNTGPWIMMGIGAFIVVMIGMVALAVYLFWYSSGGKTMYSGMTQAAPMMMEMKSPTMHTNQPMMMTPKKSTRVMMSDTMNNPMTTSQTSTGANDLLKKSLRRPERASPIMQ